jgi:hypothetical protein
LYFFKISYEDFQTSCLPISQYINRIDDTKQIRKSIKESKIADEEIKNIYENFNNGSGDGSGSITTSNRSGNGNGDGSGSVTTSNRNGSGSIILGNTVDVTTMITGSASTILVPKDVNDLLSQENNQIQDTEFENREINIKSKLFQYPKDGFKIQDPNNGNFVTMVDGKLTEVLNKNNGSKYKIIQDDINLSSKNVVVIQNLTTNKFIRYKTGIITEEDYIPNNQDFEWIVRKTGKDMYVIYSLFYNQFIIYNSTMLILSDKYSLWKMKIFPDIDIDISTSEYFTNYEPFEIITDGRDKKNKQVSINIK